jgi:hypothetical protein
MTQELRERPRGAGRVGKGLRSSGDWAAFIEQEGGAVLTPGLPELYLPSMQFPMGPACIFLRKGIAEKQRVRWEVAVQGEGSCDMGKRRGHTGAMEKGNECRKHELRRQKSPGNMEGPEGQQDT